MRTLIESMKSTSVVMEHTTVMMDCNDHQAVSTQDNGPTSTTTEMSNVKGHNQMWQEFIQRDCKIKNTFLFNVWINAQCPIWDKEEKTIFFVTTTSIRFIDYPNHVNFKPTVRFEGSTLISCSSHLLLLEDNDKTNTDTHFHDMPNSFQLSKNAVIASKTQSALITSRWNSSCPRWVWLEEMVGGNNANRRMQGTKELILCQCELHSFKIKWWQKHLTVKKESKRPNGLAELGCECSVCIDMPSWDRRSFVFWIAIEVVIEQEQEKQMAQTVVTVKCLKPQGQAACTLTSLLCRTWINSGID